MKKWRCSVAGLSLALAGSLAAQAQTPAVPPPNILSIQTDNIKPYEDGPYDKLASEYPALSWETASRMEPPKQTLQTQPTPEQIRQRAYEIYVSRNGAPGDEVQDWLQAERELSS